MKVYDIYYNAVTPRLMRSNLTEEQVDEFWNSIKWWQRQTILVKEREVTKKPTTKEWER